MSMDKKDFAFMDPVQAAYFKRTSKKARLILFTVLLFIITFIVWAMYAEVDEITRAEGRIIPSSKIQRIDHLEGGIIQDIYAKEGDIVEEGQILLRIDPTQTNARLKEGQDLYYRYFAARARLRAQISGKPFVIPPKVKENAPHVGTRELLSYNSWKRKLENEKTISQQEIDQRKQETLELQNRVKKLEEQLKLVQIEININKPLVDKGLIAKVDFLRLQRDSIQLKSEIGSTYVNIEGAKAALAQAQSRLSKVTLDFENDALKELRDVENRLAAAEESFNTEGDRLNRTEVKSPVKGIVKQLLVSTRGGVVEPGEDLVEIVPFEDALLVEAKVIPSQIASLRPGLPASVKLTAYDFAIHGSLDAELTQISADAIQDKNDPAKSFYIIRLRTLSNQLSKNDKAVAIIPGMTAIVDIITGKKTIMTYLLKPILRTKELALTEK